MSMAKIAKLLELRAQDAVTRLLKLKEFRTDVQQQLLVMLRSLVIELAKDYSTKELPCLLVLNYLIGYIICIPHL